MLKQFELGQLNGFERFELPDWINKLKELNVVENLEAWELSIIREVYPTFVSLDEARVRSILRVIVKGDDVISAFRLPFQFESPVRQKFCVALYLLVMEPETIQAYSELYAAFGAKIENFPGSFANHFQTIETIIHEQYSLQILSDRIMQLIGFVCYAQDPRPLVTLASELAFLHRIYAQTKDSGVLGKVQKDKHKYDHNYQKLFMGLLQSGVGDSANIHSVDLHTSLDYEGDLWTDSYFGADGHLIYALHYDLLTEPESKRGRFAGLTTKVDERGSIVSSGERGTPLWFDRLGGLTAGSEVANSA
jgi:hypothetical protein